MRPRVPSSVAAPVGLTGSALMVLPVIGALVARGVDPLPLLREVGIEPGSLADHSARLPDEVVQALWLGAAPHARDPDFGLHAATLYRRPLTWILDDLLATAATLREAFVLGHAQLRLLHDAADARIVSQGPLARLEILPNLSAPIARAQTDFLLACLVLGTRHLGGLRESPWEVHFRHARPTSTKALAEFFECPLFFGADVTAVVFPSAWLELPLVHNQPEVRGLTLQRAQQLLANLEARFSITTRVRVLISKEIARAEPSLDDIAKRLAMSSRTLRRRLQEAGTSYSELIDLVRRRYAARYLLDAGAPIEEVSERLGFSNPTAFFKAHKRWTGMTPTQARDARDLRMLGVDAQQGAPTHGDEASES